jgi:hypothetical protein
MNPSDGRLLHDERYWISRHEERATDAAGPRASWVSTRSGDIPSGTYSEVWLLRFRGARRASRDADRVGDAEHPRLRRWIGRDVLCGRVPREALVRRDGETAGRGLRIVAGVAGHHMSDVQAQHNGERPTTMRPKLTVIYANG